MWWDLRPHPLFGTLEFRVCDVPTSPRVTVALAALAQALVVKLYRLRRSNLGFRIYSRALVEENKWRAARYGLDGRLIDFGKRQEVPMRELALELLEFVDDVVDELGSRKALAVRPHHPRRRHQRRSAAEGLQGDGRPPRGRPLAGRGDRAGHAEEVA